MSASHHIIPTLLHTHTGSSQDYQKLALTTWKRAFTDYPDLDCVFLNAGIQSRPRLSRAAEFDFAGFHNEINVNFTCIVNLSMKFLPRLQAKTEPTGLIITGTHLGLVPAPTLAAYSASKAALTAFVDCLREQNRHKPTKIVEIYPPVVKCKRRIKLHFCPFFFSFFFFNAIVC